jgi:hypothetical protein
MPTRSVNLTLKEKIILKRFLNAKLKPSIFRWVMLEKLPSSGILVLVAKRISHIP